MLKAIQLSRLADLSKQEQEELAALLGVIEQNPLLNRMRLLKKSLIAAALQKYGQDQPIAKLYSSRA